jgi:hypothetical protein
MSLPTDRNARNAIPVWDGCIAYFPDVWAEVAKVSVLGNKQHGLGAKLHWDTTVSTDHKNKAMRHMLDDTNGEIMDDGGETFHLAKALWRVAAALQLRIWARDGKDEHGKPIVPAGTPDLLVACLCGWEGAVSELVPASYYPLMLCPMCTRTFARLGDELPDHCAKPQIIGETVGSARPLSRRP